MAQLFTHVFFDNVFASAGSPTVLIEKGAFFSCMNCTFLEGSLAARKIVNVEEEFEEENYLVLITARDNMTDYVSESALEEVFKLYQAGSKGAVILTDMAKFKINGTTVEHGRGLRRLSHYPDDEERPVDPFPNNSSYGVNP